jgi:hypothetical protein
MVIIVLEIQKKGRYSVRIARTLKKKWHSKP